MIEVKAINMVGGEYGYRIYAEEEGLYINDGGQTVFIDMGDFHEVVEAIVKTYDEYREFKQWQEKKSQKTETNI